MLALPASLQRQRRHINPLPRCENAGEGVVIFGETCHFPYDESQISGDYFVIQNYLLESMWGKYALR